MCCQVDAHAVAANTITSTIIIYHMWQSQVENERYSYHFWTTFFCSLHSCTSAVEHSRMLKRGLNNFKIAVIGTPTLVVYLQRIFGGELIEISQLKAEFSILVFICTGSKQFT